MIIVNIPAGTVSLFTIRVGDSDFIAVRDTEQFLIVRVDKADASFCLLQMTVKPLSLIAVAIQIVFAPVGVQAQHIGILLRVCTKTKLPAIAAEAAFRCPPAIGGQCTAVFQYAAIVLIKAEGVDNLVKLCFEVLCF